MNDHPQHEQQFHRWMHQLTLGDILYAIDHDKELLPHIYPAYLEHREHLIRYTKENPAEQGGGMGESRTSSRLTPGKDHDRPIS